MHKETKDVPDGSIGKEAACNAGDSCLIPGSGRTPEEGIGYPYGILGLSLWPQLVKNPPAICETCVWLLGWEDPLEKGKATHSTIPAWRIPNSIHCIVHGIAKSQTWLSNFDFPRRIKESTEERNQNIYRWRNISCSWIGLIDRVKMNIPHKTINRFNTIPLKLPTTFFIKLEQNILWVAWKHIKPQRAKAVLRKNGTREVKFSDFRLHYKDIKRVWNLHIEI